MPIHKAVKFVLTEIDSSQCLKRPWLRLIALLDNKSNSLLQWLHCGKIIHHKQEELWMLQGTCKVVIASSLVSFFSDRQSVLQVTFCKNYCVSENNNSINISELWTFSSWKWPVSVHRDWKNCNLQVRTSIRIPMLFSGHSQPLVHPLTILMGTQARSSSVTGVSSLSTTYMPFLDRAWMTDRWDWRDAACSVLRMRAQTRQ